MSLDVTLARVYKHTVQRVICDLAQLNSNAAFLFVSKEPNRVYIWIGEKCSAEDQLYAEQIAVEIVEDDFASATDCHIETILEAKCNEAALLDLLDTLWLSIEDYNCSLSQRKATIQNKAVALGVLERRKGTRELRMKFLCEESLLTNGAVRPIAVPQIMNSKSVVVVTIGDIFEVWLGSDVSKPEQAAIKLFLINYALQDLPEEERNNVATQFSLKNLAIYRKDPPKLFRIYFRSDTIGALTGSGEASAARGRRGPSTARRAPVRKTNIFSSKCTDCVGETIMSLLGMRDPSRGDTEDDVLLSNVYDSSNSYDEEDASLKAKQSASSSSQPSDAVNGTGEDFIDISSADMKIAYAVDAEDIVPDEVIGADKVLFDPVVVAAKVTRAQLRTNIRYVNHARKGMKLLVLDLDHTLMDFSQRHSTKNVMRPHLFRFLREVYVNYDIVIWSQTSSHWLYLKLAETSLLNHPDFKICFALDKLSMFSINQVSVKPLQVLWNICPEKWSASNTVHVDDLARNFEVNPQNGILVKPFYISSIAMDSKSSLENKVPFKTSSTEDSELDSSVGVGKEQEDNELLLLAKYLTQIANEKDFLLLDHSAWRERVSI